MGVKGLTTFFNQNPDLFKSYELHDTAVIIDGNNLIHTLYLSYRVNFMFGGDYKKYADAIRKYISIYLDCNIKPIIIFDGGYEKSDRKLRTTVARSRNRLSLVQYIAKHGCCSGLVLPVLAYEVFYSVLKKLNISFANCDYEADDQITALANFYKCPVISGDSDFYIFDIHNGFIHFNFLDTTVCAKKDSDGNEYKYLACKIYYIEKFVSYFPGLDKEALPLFGTLMGNDSVKESEFQNFFLNIPLPKYKDNRLISSAKQKKIMGVLCWLQKTTLDKAVDQIALFMKKERRDYIKSVIQKSVDCYVPYYCNLLSFVHEKEDIVKIDLHSHSRLTAPCQTVLPADFILKFHQGYLPAFFINVIVLHRIFLSPQIEMISCPSSYTCSLYIRQVIYGILIRHDAENGECKDKTCLSPIEEYGRQHQNLSKTFVNPIFEIEGIKLLPKLNELSNLPTEKCKDIMLNVLNIKSGLFLNIPEKWQLFIACVNYWLRNCEPHSTQAFLSALAMNLIYFSVIKAKNILYDTDFCKKACTDLTCSCHKIPCILSSISESELKHAEKRLGKYTHKPPFNHGNPLLLSIVNSYSQLQTCILYSIYLNKLLNNSIGSIGPDNCFSGTLLYNIAKDIGSRPNPELFVAEVLGRDSNLHALFLQLNLKMCENVPDSHILKNTSTHKKSKKSKKCKASYAEKCLLMNEELDSLNLTDNEI